MSKYFSLVFFLICSLSIGASAQVIRSFDRAKDGRHLGFYADLNQNMGSNLVSKNGNASTFAPFLRIGVEYRYHLTRKLYFRTALSVGTGNFSYKYIKEFAPTSDTTFPKGVMGRRGISVPVFEPHFEIGRYFDIAQKHRIDVRVGVSLPLYLAKITSQSDTTYSTTVLSTKDRVRYGTTESLNMNDENKHYGNGNANLYIGYKRLNYNELTDKISVGLTFGYSFFNSNAALSVSNAYNVTYKYQMGKDVVQKLSYASIGIRFAYEIF
ncbi:hypothetical protein DBR32_09125 [Taibaiella sp. KBW10]|uniref:hypothetical protein n=1 Tax=Taibaiella sp. KBW10 TaxID=2153357 RepID=UPI000F5972DC|nr:hypothetical protein [Taibaiella sp. KBW10]RQO30868.1 hypothetical protein DBR32_09125 [Taibaiella sp. KBW10]